MNNRGYTFDNDLKENNEIYKSLEKELKGISKNEYGLINKKITSAWIRCGSNYERFNSILERLVWNSVIDKNIEAIIIEMISKFDNQPLHKDSANFVSDIFFKTDNTRNRKNDENAGNDNFWLHFFELNLLKSDDNVIRFIYLFLWFFNIYGFYFWYTIIIEFNTGTLDLNFWNNLDGFLDTMEYLFGVVGYFIAFMINFGLILYSFMLIPVIFVFKTYQLILYIWTGKILKSGL
ncbi:MAG: hypothetical protein ACJ0BU_00130 [Candidatus Puniceispirillales bacterium]